MIRGLLVKACSSRGSAAIRAAGRGSKADMEEGTFSNRKREDFPP